MPGGGGPAGAGAGGGGGRGKAKKGGALRRAASHAQLSADLKASIASWLRKRGKAVRPELTKEEREEIKVRVGAAAPPPPTPPTPPGEGEAAAAAAAASPSPYMAAKASFTNRRYRLLSLRKFS